MYLLDTNGAIHLREGDAAVTAHVASLDGALLMSVITFTDVVGLQLVAW